MKNLRENYTIPARFDDDWKRLIKEGGRQLGIGLDNRQLDLFALHAEQLKIWNRKMNLTGIKEPFDVAVNHFIDSIAMLPYVKKDAKILDIGSGGGFPSIPLKIVRPSIDLIMVDASRKKIHFLTEMIRRLCFKNVRALHCRVEDLSKNHAFTKEFDIVLSRAFSSLDTFTELAFPFLSPHGVIIAMKGKKGLKEMESLRKDEMDIHAARYTLPFTKAERIIFKIAPQRSISLDR